MTDRSARLRPSRRTPPGLDFRITPEARGRFELRDDDYIFYANDVGVLTIPTEAEVSKYGSRVDDMAPSPLPTCRTCGVAFRRMPDSDGQCDTCLARSKTLITGGKREITVKSQKSTFKVKGAKGGVDLRNPEDLNALLKGVYAQPLLDDLDRLVGAGDASEIWDETGRVEIESEPEYRARMAGGQGVGRTRPSEPVKPKFEEKPKGRRINLDE